MTDAYSAFLERKSQANAGDGFAPTWTPDFLFDFQQALDLDQLADEVVA